MSLARRHFEHHSAKQAAEQSAVYGEMMHATTYELKLAELANDRHRLKQLQSTELKIELKNKLIDNYLPYTDGVIESGAGVQDEVLMMVLVWCLDIRNYTQALKIAEYALKHNLVMPDVFKRTTACLVVEEMADNEIKRFKAGDSIDIDSLLQLHALMSRDDLPELATDMPDQVRAKLYLIIGRYYVAAAKEANDTELGGMAVDALSMALSLDDKCGGKADLAAAKKLAA